jgi:hypothetical protein
LSPEGALGVDRAGNNLFSREGTAELADRVGKMWSPLEATEDLEPLLGRIGDARCVLLGEASHGTSEYYRWRARISEYLIREKGLHAPTFYGYGSVARVRPAHQLVTEPSGRRRWGSSAIRKG